MCLTPLMLEVNGARTTLHNRRGYLFPWESAPAACSAALHHCKVRVRGRGRVSRVEYQVSHVPVQGRRGCACKGARACRRAPLPLIRGGGTLCPGLEELLPGSCFVHSVEGPRAHVTCVCSNWHSLHCGHLRQQAVSSDEPACKSLPSGQRCAASSRWLTAPAGWRWQGWQARAAAAAARHPVTALAAALTTLYVVIGALQPQTGCTAGGRP